MTTPPNSPTEYTAKERTVLDRVVGAMNSLESLLDNYKLDGVDVDDIATQTTEIVGGLRPLIPLLRSLVDADDAWEAARGPSARMVEAQRVTDAQENLLAALRRTPRDAKEGV